MPPVRTSAACRAASRARRCRRRHRGRPLGPRAMLEARLKAYHACSAASIPRTISPPDHAALERGRPGRGRDHPPLEPKPAGGCPRGAAHWLVRGEFRHVSSMRKGRWQSWAGAAKLVGDSRPGWKVLRVHGESTRGFKGADYVSSDEVRDALKRSRAASARRCHPPAWRVLPPRPATSPVQDLRTGGRWDRGWIFPPTRATCWCAAPTRIGQDQGRARGP